MATARGPVAKTYGLFHDSECRAIARSSRRSATERRSVVAPAVGAAVILLLFFGAVGDGTYRVAGPARESLEREPAPLAEPSDPESDRSARLYGSWVALTGYSYSSW
jgi:hypothetical protein